MRSGRWVAWLAAIHVLVLSPAVAQEPGGLGPDFERELMGAEALFRRGEADGALERFEALVLMDPWRSRAWLRIGNLHHRAGRHEQARTAYRHATIGSPADPLDEDAQLKAYVNLALLGVQQAGEALQALDERDATRMQPAREQVRRDLDALQRRLGALPILRHGPSATETGSGGR
jgi:DNA-binding SARP family transcriptional activator